MHNYIVRSNDDKRFLALVIANNLPHAMLEARDRGFKNFNVELAPNPPIFQN